MKSVGRNFTAAYALALCGVLLVNVLRDIATQLPHQLSDETAFLLSAKYFLHWDLIYSLGYKPVPGLLFLRIASFLANWDKYYLAAKLLNALYLTLAAVPAYLVARRVMPDRQAKVASLLVAVTPVTIYGAYFTPEAMYIFLFWLFAAASVAALETPSSAAAALISGVACASAYLVKPHAVALAGAYVASAAILCAIDIVRPSERAHAQWRARTAIANIALFAIGGIVALLLLGRLLGGDWLASFELRLYSDLVTRKAALADAPVGDIARLIGLHAAAIVGALAVPIAALAGASPRLVPTERTWRVVAIFSVAVVSMLVLMTARASVEFFSIYGGSNTLDRLHGRYYFFALPLLVFAAVGHVRLVQPTTTSWKGMAGLLAPVAVFACIAVTARQTFTFLDAPDLAYLLDTRTIVAAVCVAALVATALALMRTTSGWLVVGGWAFMCVVNVYAATRLQHNEDREQTGDRAVGILRSLFQRPDLDDGLIVAGDHPVAAARAAFRLASRSPVVATVEDARARMNSSTKWILVTGDRSGRAFQWSAIIVGDSAVYLADAARIVPAQSRDARAVYSLAANGASPATATPANAPESWGTWLSGADARISFPAPLPDRGTLTLVASVLDPARQSPVELSICGKTYPVTLTTVLAAHRVEYACAMHSDQVRIAGMKPLSPRDIGLSSDPRALALALRSIEVEPAGR